MSVIDVTGNSAKTASAVPKPRPRLAPDEELFSEAAPEGAPETARITCRVCGLRVAVQLGHPALLCSNCLIDLVITRAHVRATLEASEATHAAAWSVFDQALHAANEADQARYAAVVEAEQKVDAGAMKQEAYDAGIQKALDRGDGLSAILCAKRAASDAYAALDRVRNWARVALEEIAVARLALPQLAPGEYLLPANARVERCRSCGAGVVWTKTETGKAIPLSLALVEERGGQRVTKTHFVDCPESRQWRRT